MLTNLKDWIEGLFRPVIHVSGDGRQYIDRTPTIDDLDLIRRRRTIINTVASVAGSYPNNYYDIPASNTFKIVRKVITGIASHNEIQGTYIECYPDSLNDTPYAITPVTNGTATYWDGTLGSMLNVFDDADTINVIKPGDTWRIHVSANLQAGRTLKYIIEYEEVELW